MQIVEWPMSRTSGVIAAVLLFVASSYSGCICKPSRRELSSVQLPPTIGPEEVRIDTVDPIMISGDSAEPDQVHIDTADGIVVTRDTADPEEVRIDSTEAIVAINPDGGPAQVETAADGDDGLIFKSTQGAILRIEASLTEFDASESSTPVRIVSGEMDQLPEGRLRLIKLIAQSGSSSIFEAALLDWSGVTRGRVVVKYTNNCREVVQRGMHARSPLMPEATFMYVLRSAQLVPAPIHLSPLRLVTRVRTLPTRLKSNYLVENALQCAGIAHTRFLVQEKAGIDLFAYFDHLQNTTSWIHVAKRAVSIAIRVVRMLKSLHRMGIVHGDIHGGNILFRAPMDTPEQVLSADTDMVFVDFEYAVFFPPEIGNPVRNPFPNSLNPTWLSPWQLLHHRIGRRDDIYRLIEWLADILSNGAVFARFNERVQRPAATRQDELLAEEALAKFKPIETMFSHVPIEGEAVRAELEHIARAHIASYNHPDARPEYDGIVAHLEAVLLLLSS